MKRAFNASFWKHAILFLFLFVAWWWVYIGLATHAGMVCGPVPPSVDHPLPANQPWMKEFPDVSKGWFVSRFAVYRSRHGLPQSCLPCTCLLEYKDVPSIHSVDNHSFFFADQTVLAGATWQPEKFLPQESQDPESAQMLDLSQLVCLNL